MVCSSFSLTLLIICLCCSLIKCDGILNNYPITFTMSGSSTYTPDAGGATRSGYNLRIGYMNHQWIGVQIITGTNKNDVLIVQIDEFYTQGTTSIRTGH